MDDDLIAALEGAAERREDAAAKLKAMASYVRTYRGLGSQTLAAGREAFALKNEEDAAAIRRAIGLLRQRGTAAVAPDVDYNIVPGQRTSVPVSAEGAAHAAAERMRERCAKIAEANDSDFDLYRRSGRNISAAIRALPLEDDCG